LQQHDIIIVVGEAGGYGGAAGFGFVAPGLGKIDPDFGPVGLSRVTAEGGLDNVGAGDDTAVEGDGNAGSHNCIIFEAANLNGKIE
jgi:hypothetical protein